MTRFGYVFLGAALLIAVAPASRAQTRLIELDDYYRVETASDAAISPNGELVAFTRSYIDEQANQRRKEIWLARSDGSLVPRRVSNAEYDAERPRFSPDGTRLTFQSNREDGGIWFLDLRSGGEAFRIDGVHGEPSYSPDGKWIAFTKPTPPKAPKPKRSELENKLDERFSGLSFDWMQFRFDRRGYLPDPRDPHATPPRELYMVASEGGEPRQITALGVDITDFSWSPDSSSFVVTADSHQRDEYVYPRADLWLVPIEGTTTRLTDDGYHHSTPDFSADGERIAFRRVKGLSMVIEAHQHHGAPTDVFVMELDTKRMRNVTENWGLRPGRPRFDALDKHLLFEAGIRGDSHLFRVDLADGSVSQVTEGARRLSGFSFSDDFSVMAFVGEDPLHPAELFVAKSKPEASEEKRLSKLNDHWLAELRLRQPEHLLYPSEDGTEIEGWYLSPADGTPTPHPLILSVHGGPHGAYGNRFMFEFQLVVAQGYGLVYTNPRGSSGYGEDFLYATWGGWGLKDSEDVLAGVDHVIDRHPIDTKRLGLTGYSYGGFLTNWILGQTTRFAAAISGAGISNWVSDYATADIPRTKESEFYGPPWEEESGALLRRLSPITHVGNVRTPTLFIHGETDYRVPVEQAEQMYVSLKKQRVPAKFIRYPNSFHGGWAPWDMVHRYYYGLQWWEHYLSESSVQSQ